MKLSENIHLTHLSVSPFPAQFETTRYHFSLDVKGTQVEVELDDHRRSPEFEF